MLGVTPCLTSSMQDRIYPAVCSSISHELPAFSCRAVHASGSRLYRYRIFFIVQIEIRVSLALGKGRNKCLKTNAFAPEMWASESRKQAGSFLPKAWHGLATIVAIFCQTCGNILPLSWQENKAIFLSLWHGGNPRRKKSINLLKS